MRQFTHVFVFLTFTGCATVSIPIAPGASLPDRAPAESAIVLFVLGDYGDPVPRFGGLPPAWLTDGRGVDILDERGDMLGRLRSRSWLAVERPPGHQVFYAVPTQWLPQCIFGPCPEGDARVGLLRANLEPGEIYAVWLGTSVERATMAGEYLCQHARDEVNFERSRMSLLPEWRTARMASFDLLVASGAAWATVNDLFHDERTVAVPVAPRGLRRPSVDEALAAANARVGRCWDERRSTISPDDGVAERPRATPLRGRVAGR